MGEIDWDTICAAVSTELGAEVTVSRDARFEAPDEVWFSVKWPKTADQMFARGSTCIWSRGELLVAKEPVEAPARCAVARNVLYHYLDSLFIEMADYGEGKGIVTFAVDNGWAVLIDCAPGTFEERVQHYASVGFVRVGAWHLDESTVVRRNFVGPERKYAAVRLDGNVVTVGKDVNEYPDRVAAEAEMEKAIAKLHVDGFRCRQLESQGSSGDNPPAVTPLHMPPATVWPEPTSANDAVDQAVARVTQLHNLYPRANMVLELLNLPADETRMEALGGSHYPKWFPRRLGRWLRLSSDVDKTQDPRKAANSFDYLLQRYGTFTWSVATPWLSPPVHTFNSGNVSGGPRCVVAIESDAYGAIEDMSEAMEDPAVLKLQVFDGGWRYALDTSVTASNGEHPIVRFSEGEPEFYAGDVSSIEPFGMWLLRRVVDIEKDLVPWLARVNGPPTDNTTT
jgi:hypothetical protein